MLETFLSGGSFTDILSEMSYYIDVGEQDKALAKQIAEDQETLAAIHATIEDTRVQTNLIRQETAAQKRELDASLRRSRSPRPQLKKLEKRDEDGPGRAEEGLRQLARNKAAPAAMNNEAAAKERLARQIDKLIDQQYARGNIPSSSTARWGGRWTARSQASSAAAATSATRRATAVSTSTTGSTSSNNCGSRQPRRAVAYVGWNFGDGFDPAWIVVIAHSRTSRPGTPTWRRPGRYPPGSPVKQGQVIGREASTGNSTGATSTGWSR